MRIPKLYSFTIRELLVLGGFLFLVGLAAGQLWRILQVEPYYEKEIKAVSSKQEQNRKKMANVEGRLMDVEKKLKIPWRPYERTVAEQGVEREVGVRWK